MRTAGLFLADLHLHSRRSGAGHHPGMRGRGVADGPLQIYAAAQARRLDLVTLTDLGTIDGCLEVLERHPGARDFLVSTELRARDPRSGRRLSVLLYDITEAQFREAARRREDARALAAWVREEDVVASVSLFARWPRLDGAAGMHLAETLARFDRFEVRNGMLPRAQNELRVRLLQEALGGRPFAMTAGSGAHTRHGVGRALTIARAGTREEFLAALRAGRTWVAGRDGAFLTGAREIWSMVGNRSALDGDAAPPPWAAFRPILRHGLREARRMARLRRMAAHLDRVEIQRFKEKTRAYGGTALTSGPGTANRA